MADARSDLLQGTLEMLVLKTLSLEPMHGWGVSCRLREISNEVFDVNQGSLYPALQRMLRRGWIVVDDVRHNALTREVKTQFYATLAQFARSPGNTRRSMTLVVRTGDDPRSLIGPVRAAIRELDPRLPVTDIRTMDDVVGASIAEPRFAMQLLGLFGALAITLAAIGVFGIVSQVVASRAQEFGIRSALGASPRELVLLSVGAGVRQAAVGLVLGVAVALLLTRALTTLLHGVTPNDPLTFAAVVAVTGLVALAASVGPARRAARTNPAAVLHEG